MNHRFSNRWQKAGPLWVPQVLPNPGFIASQLRPLGGGGGSVTEVGTPTLATGSAYNPTATISHTVPSGCNRLVVRISSYQNFASAVAWNTSENFTQAGTGTSQSGGGNEDRAAIWTLANPTAGTFNIVVTFPGSTGAVIYITNYSGVGSVGTAAGDTDGSVDVSLNANGIAIDVHSGYNYTPTQGGSQTLEQFQNNGGSYQSGAFSKRTGSGTVALSWTGGSTRAQHAVPLNP